MALPSTLHRFTIDLSDIDRGVYEPLEFQLARHPSETVGFALTRVLAYALEYREGLVFGRGIGNPDEPALSVPGEHGGTSLWIDVGSPSAERLHKANKHADELVVYTHKSVEMLRQMWSGTEIHGASDIRLVVVDAGLLSFLEPLLDRRNAWQIVRTEGELYITVGSASWTGHLRVETVG